MDSIFSNLESALQHIQGGKASLTGGTHTNTTTTIPNVIVDHGNVGTTTILTSSTQTNIPEIIVEHGDFGTTTVVTTNTPEVIVEHDYNETGPPIRSGHPLQATDGFTEDIYDIGLPDARPTGPRFPVDGFIDDIHYYDDSIPAQIENFSEEFVRPIDGLPEHHIIVDGQPGQLNHSPDDQFTINEDIYPNSSGYDQVNIGQAPPNMGLDPSSVEPYPNSSGSIQTPIDNLGIEDSYNTTPIPGGYQQVDIGEPNPDMGLDPSSIEPYQNTGGNVQTLIEDLGIEDSFDTNDDYGVSGD